MSDIARHRSHRTYTIHRTDAARKRLARRYAAEARFKALGLAAVLSAMIALVLLLSTIVTQAIPAFTMNYATLAGDAFGRAHRSGRSRQVGLRCSGERRRSTRRCRLPRGGLSAARRVGFSRTPPASSCAKRCSPIPRWWARSAPDCAACLRYRRSFSEGSDRRTRNRHRGRNGDPLRRQRRNHDQARSRGDGPHSRRPFRKPSSPGGPLCRATRRAPRLLSKPRRARSKG